ncbi:glycine betaine carnitine ABC transporter ATP-binding subunit [Lentilactobacillus senioris DSM 24302 = JCM 17472]|uniref:Quaternary amine transport ATP-binding protein n=1 Tax=Lentilactobacillus senioris DSM 24302 = JCM 17472 TaxID=1423802 RepID=A0A0R2D1A1_9LACO|nr:glycine betaine/L-proline ABC transporter ATP-binding protein [Lentilactobacillus senioris]KRM94265.1 glycine betaine carnitine ABC transporter ATP-binding subunit [Lentilactobacillus senioris DSM 24302 = JCM 17472]
MTTKVEVKNLTKIFGKRVNKAKKLLADGASKADILKETGATIGVDRANFTVEDGEIFVIMGLSGSGKSTTIRMLNRLIDPTSGQVILDGKDVMDMNKDELREMRRHKMSMVFQNFALLPNRTVLENAEYGLEIQGVDKATRQQKASEALEMVGLTGYNDQYPTQLSGGMQQRVGLARALANDPEILLMDEAFSALDPLNRKEMQNELLDLQENMQKTIIFISHDLNEALRIGDHIMIMRDGEIVQIGSPEDILTHPANDYVERFIEDVDRSKVLTASKVMIRPVTVNIEKDGPRLALRRMRENEISSLYVIDNKHQMVGLIDSADVIQLIKDNNRSLSGILKHDVPTVELDTPLKEMMDEASHSPVPIAVLDDKQRLRGIIIRGAILDALNGNGGVEHV